MQRLIIPLLEAPIDVAVLPNSTKAVVAAHASDQALLSTAYGCRLVFRALQQEFSNIQSFTFIDPIVLDTLTSVNAELTNLQQRNSE